MTVAYLSHAWKRERLPAKATWLDAAGEPQQELLTNDFFRALKPRPGVGIAVLESEDEMCSEMLRRREFIVHVWGPDLEKIFPSGKPASQSQKISNLPTPAERKKRKRRKEHDWVAIRIEIMRRVVKTLPEGPDNVAEVAREVRAWCVKKYSKQPAFSAMREEVGKIVAGLRALLD
jgi:hypothetical protein